MKTRLMKWVLATLAGGFSMWVVAGLWHNLILPFFSESVEAHHEGLGIMLVAYFILSFLMTYVYSLSYKGGKPLVEGLRIGVVVGVLWVFPHGLAMAGAHDTSILYEIENALWHIVEQGIGGIVVAFLWGNKTLAAAGAA